MGNKWASAPGLSNAPDFSTIADIINSGHHAGIKNIGIITPQASRLQ